MFLIFLLLLLFSLGLRPYGILLCFHEQTLEILLKRRIHKQDYLAHQIKSHLKEKVLPTENPAYSKEV